jgi:hypothetical protein
LREENEPDERLREENEPDERLPEEHSALMSACAKNIPR